MRLVLLMMTQMAPSRPDIHEEDGTRLLLAFLASSALLVYGSVATNRLPLELSTRLRHKSSTSDTFIDAATEKEFSFIRVLNYIDV